MSFAIIRLESASRPLIPGQFDRSRWNAAKMKMGKSEDSNKSISEAIRHLEEGDLAKAFQIASDVLAVMPNDADANFICARHLIETGDMDRSQDHLEKAISVRPSFTDAHHAVGVLNQIVGRNDAAIAAFTKALELDPSHLQANLSLGLLYCNSGNLADALFLVEKVIPSMISLKNEILYFFVRN